MRRAAGSSPLARGLQTGQRSAPATRRIIPARAGFTYEHGRRRPRLRDHPRSRGVYSTGRGRPRPTRGSSPLARGLRDVVGEGVGVAGIIPARAGFTFRAMPDGGTKGIIPARAGFTWCPPWTGLAVGDHPRSRGVYPITLAPVSGGLGSSPLARGLRTTAEDHLLAAGIIPARAGFTRHPRKTSPARPGSSPLARGLLDALIRRRRALLDHPRSRGVYSTTLRTTTTPWGSSPLARGLLVNQSPCVVITRIIPARAGFTAARCATGASPRDHPRSRGVYGHSEGCSEATTGSSPLARGLPVAPA